MYNDVRVLDVHGHVSPPFGGLETWLTFMLGSNGPMPDLMSAPGQAVAARYGLGRDDMVAPAAEHVKVLDVRNIDVQLIGPRPFLTFGWMEDHLLAPWARAVNDVIAQQCALHPDRFVGACQLPQDAHAADTRHVLDELDRCVNDYGFAAAYVSPDPTGRRDGAGMDEPYWYPLYERCAELDVPIIVHGTNCLDKRLRRVPNNYQLGFVAEQYWAGQVLSHSDVFSRYPGLRVMICHCGGALNRFMPSDPHLSQQDLSANLFYDTCAHDLVFLEAAIRQRGVPVMCFGTEAPGSGGAIRPESGRPADDLVAVLAEFSFLTEADRVAIFHDNPLRLVPGLKAVA